MESAILFKIFVGLNVLCAGPAAFGLWHTDNAMNFEDVPWWAHKLARWGVVLFFASFIPPTIAYQMGYLVPPQ